MRHMTQHMITTSRHSLTECAYGVVSSYALDAHFLGKGAITTYLIVLGLTRLGLKLKEKRESDEKVHRKR
jgi:hypothetical protein